MEYFDKKKNIIKLITSNKEGVTVFEIIDFLDYFNKVKYNRHEIEIILNKLIVDEIIFIKNSLYFIKK
ncbi:MAG: hypothetical protein RIQ59_1855 [Bacteroidota bacterium]|jgi:hypothetical protein